MQEILREAGYVASNSEKYPVGGIISAIENVFQATPEIECSGDAVEELYLCFYKDFKVRPSIYILPMLLVSLQTRICIYSSGLISHCFYFSKILFLLLFPF